MAKKKAKKAPKKAPAKKKATKKKAPAKKKAKRAPKKRKPVQKKVQVSVAAVPVGEEEEAGMTRLRWMAGQIYATNMRGYSITEMKQLPIFQDIHLRTLEAWSLKDKWVENRREVQEKIRVQVENRIATEIAKHRSDQLKTMQTIFDDAIDKLMPKPRLATDGNGKPVLDPEGNETYFPGAAPDVKSYEGLVNAITRLSEVLDSQRERLGETLTPQMFVGDDDEGMGSAGATPIQPQLSQEEARAAAKLLIQMRRDKMRTRLKEVDAQLDPTEA